MMDDKKTYHTFPKPTGMKLYDVLSMIRPSGYSNYDEMSSNIIICPESEEWTWVKFNVSSCLLDLLGDLTVEGLEADECDIRLWIKTDDYNWIGPKPKEE